MVIEVKKNYSCKFLMKLEILSPDFRKIFTSQFSLKSVWWEPSCSMRTDERTGGQTERRTNMMKAPVTVRCSAERPKTVLYAGDSGKLGTSLSGKMK
jgi:hypothetical protein